MNSLPFTGRGWLFCSFSITELSFWLICYNQDIQVVSQYFLIYDL